MTETQTKMEFANLSSSWEAEARQWIQWARAPGHDSYWRFHRDQFLGLLPPPGRQTLDIGCGEGRLARDLKELGHRIVGIDSSPSLIAAARDLDPSMDVRLADAAALAVPDERYRRPTGVFFGSLHGTPNHPIGQRRLASQSGSTPHERGRHVSHSHRQARFSLVKPRPRRRSIGRLPCSAFHSAIRSESQPHRC